jgi:hypothetical protein
MARHACMHGGRPVRWLWLWLWLGSPLVVGAMTDCSRIYMLKNGNCAAPSVEMPKLGRRGKGEGGLPTCVAGRFNSRSPFVLTQVRTPAYAYPCQRADPRRLGRRTGTHKPWVSRRLWVNQEEPRRYS